MLSRKRELRQSIGIGGSKVQLDDQSFSQSYRLCDLAVCQGMCCYDGVYLDSCEVDVLESLTRDQAGRFRALGIDFSSSPITRERQPDGTIRYRTATHPFDYGQSAEFPEHFERTACVFRCGDGRCSLQQIAVDLDKDPWYFKPMGCWMHPLELRLGAKPTLSVSGFGKSPFGSNTQCGRSCAGGAPGYQVFERELRALSEVLGQDLLVSQK